MLDCISGGRLVAGLPLGSPMDANLSYGITPIEQRERYREALDLVIRRGKPARCSRGTAVPAARHGEPLAAAGPAAAPAGVGAGLGQHQHVRLRGRARRLLLLPELLRRAAGKR